MEISAGKQDILYVSGLFMPASGGAELSIFTTLKYLTKLGFRIHVITGGNEIDSDICNIVNTQFSIKRINKISLLDQTINSVLKENKNIFAVITQNLWSDQAIVSAKKNRLPVIYFARNPFGNLDISKTSPFSCDFIFANSKATKDYVEQKNHLKNIEVIPPIIDYDDYITDSNSKKFITIVNPIEIKGGDIFKDIAKKLPDRKFLAVLGWEHLKHGNTWNVTRLQELANCFRANLYIPKETNFDNEHNVTVQSTVTDMRIVYSQTRLLLVPSSETESIPRVILESMINGIPIIGSNVGSIASTVGEGGKIIQNRTDIDEWVSAIKYFDDDNYYTKCSINAIFRAQTHSPSRYIVPLVKVLTKLQASV